MTRSPTHSLWRRRLCYLVMIVSLMGPIVLPAMRTQAIASPREEQPVQVRPERGTANQNSSILPATDSPSLLLEVVKLLADDGAADDRFGWSAAISGTTVVIGAATYGSIQGAAYVFEQDYGGPGNWGQVRKLTASDGEAEDWFAESVSLGGDTLVAGAYGDGNLVGAAYIFERNYGGPANWGQVKKLTASDGVDWDFFGCSVSIDGDTIAVGAWGVSSDRGAVYIFERSQGGADNWGQVAKLTDAAGEVQDHFGYAVALDEDTLLVGARGHNVGWGKACIFERNQGGADNWGQVAVLSAPDGDQQDFFGENLALRGDIAVIGATGHDSGGENAGAAYVFERDQGGVGSWGLVKKLVAPDAKPLASFGDAMAIEGDVAIIASPTTDGIGTNTGAAYRFERDQGGAGNWGFVDKLVAPDGQDGDGFSSSVASHGGVIVVGAANDDDLGQSSGSAYVFSPVLLPEPAWIKQVYINGVLTDTFPALIAAADTVEIVDQAWITYTSAVTFTLAGSWTAALDLTDWSTNVGIVITTAGALTWDVNSAVSNTWHTLTKTFQVLEGSWSEALVTESLWVQAADPQLPDRRIEFTFSVPMYNLYLPLLLRNASTP